MGATCSLIGMKVGGQGLGKEATPSALNSMNGHWCHLDAIQRANASSCLPGGVVIGDSDSES